MQNVQIIAAQMNRQAAEALAQAAQEMGDRITWRPLDKGRSALDQVLECGVLNGWGARVFAEQQTAPTVDWEEYQHVRKENETPEKALALLASGTAALAKAIREFPTEKMSEKVTLPFGEGMEKSFAELALFFYWNTTYHEGQVNYIQTLTDE